MNDPMLRITEWHNGEKVSGPFSDSEMSRRQGALRDKMDLFELDACLLTSIHNIAYFSGFVYCAFGRRYGLVIDHDRCTSISAGIDGGQPFRMTYGSNITYTDWQKDNYWHAVKSLTNGVTRLGVEADHLSVESVEMLRAALPDVKLIDIAQETMSMRTIKSQEEIDHIRVGAEVADIGGAAAVEAVSAGVGEHEVALASTAAMVREIATRFDFVELMDTWTWFQSGINTDGAHNPVTNRRIERGDILSLNCFPMIFGYYTALERTLFCQTASPQHLRYWDFNCQVHRRGLELIKPGVRCMDIAAELNEMYRQEGLLKYRSFGYGHSFGVLSHYYGREAAVELREDVETELKPGMVVSMEPMIMIPENLDGAGGYREHDILVIHHNGTVENLTGFPFGSEHLVVS